MSIERVYDPKPSITQDDPKKKKKRILTDIQKRVEAEYDQLQGNLTTFEQAFGNVSEPPRASATSYREKAPPMESELEALGKACFKWAKECPDALKIRQFFHALDYDYSEIERFRGISKAFARYYYMALDVIGDRREISALNRKASESIVMFTMTNYDPDWRRIFKERAEVKAAAEGAKTGNITVVMQAIPNSTEVPERGKPQEITNED